jgi:sarcosine oxidase subunit gamma
VAGAARLEDSELAIELLDAASLATIVVRQGQDAELARRTEACLECGVPETGRVERGAVADLVWSAPGQWLAVSRADAAFKALAEQMGDVAAVTDQSDSRALVKVSGTSARNVLAKGVAIDLHPKSFRTGSSAVTKVAHLSVQIWQVDETPTYMIAVPRSFAGSFWSWLKIASGAQT